MHLLAIFGSPRKDGFSSKIHEELLIPFSERGFIIDRVYAYDENIKPCTGCGYCKQNSSCIISDQMTGIYSLIKKADIISISSPLYFSSLPSPLKAIIDRCQVLWEENKNNSTAKHCKNGIFICAAGSEYRDMFYGAVQCIKHFFNAINVRFIPEDSILYPSSDSSPEIASEFIKKTHRIGTLYSDNYPV